MIRRLFCGRSLTIAALDDRHVLEPGDRYRLVLTVDVGPTTAEGLRASGAVVVETVLECTGRELVQVRS